MSDSQTYEYWSEPGNPEIKLFKTKTGTWRERNQDRTLGNAFAMGTAKAYYDFSF